MSNQFNSVIGVVPSIVDVHHFYSTTEEWRASLETLHLAPGEWSETDGTADQSLALSQLPESAIKVGSSVLAVMAVLPNCVRQNSLLYATMAYDGEGCEDPDSTVFHAGAKQLGITTRAIPLRGENPAVHAFVDPLSGERSFLKQPGVSRDITELPNFNQAVTDSTVIALDAYELITGKTGETLRSIIDRAAGNIALSLGNTAILGDELKSFIRTAGHEGRLHSVFGNEEEFSVLLDDREPLTEDRLMEAQRELQAHIVTTRGSQGISAVVHGHYYHAAASRVQPTSIVSTSGAGDAAMGIILGGIIEVDPIDLLLRKATAHCANVVQSADDILPMNIL